MRYYVLLCDNESPTEMWYRSQSRIAMISNNSARRIHTWLPPSTIWLLICGVLETPPASNASPKGNSGGRCTERMRVRFHDGFSLEGSGVADRRIMLARIRGRRDTREGRATVPLLARSMPKGETRSSSSSSTHLTIRVRVHVRAEGGSYLQRGTSLS